MAAKTTKAKNEAVEAKPEKKAAQAKKEKKHSSLSSKDAYAQKTALVKELLAAQLSLDHEGLRARGGMAGAKRELRLLNQRIAATQTK